MSTHMTVYLDVTDLLRRPAADCTGPAGVSNKKRIRWLARNFQCSQIRARKILLSDRALWAPAEPA